MKLRQLILKDIKNVVYDVKSLAILVIMPVVIMTILGFSLKGMFSSDVSSGVTLLNVAVVKEYDLDQDIERFKEESKTNSMINGENIDIDSLNMETIFFDDFLDHKDMQEFISYRLADASEIPELMDADAISAAIYLPENFVYDGLINFAQGGRKEMGITVETNPDYSFSSSIVVSIMKEFTDNLNLQKARNSALIGDLMANDLSAYLGNITDNMSDSPTLDVVINKESVDQQKSISSFQYYAAAIMSMFLLYAASFGGKAILSERKEYTLARMSVAGITIYHVIISNFVRIAMLCILQSAFMIVFSRLVLGVIWGNPLSVIIGMLLMSTTVGAIGMLLSVITLSTGNYRIANFFEFIIIQFMALVGGSFIQLEVLPEPIRNLSFLSVSGLGIKMYSNAMYDLPLSSSFASYRTLLLYTVATLLVTMFIVQVSGKKVKAC